MMGNAIFFRVAVMNDMTKTSHNITARTQDNGMFQRV